MYTNTNYTLEPGNLDFCYLGELCPLRLKCRNTFFIKLYTGKPRTVGNSSNDLFIKNEIYKVIEMEECMVEPNAEAFFKLNYATVKVFLFNLIKIAKVASNQKLALYN